MVDWFYSSHGKGLSYTVELRPLPTSPYDFRLPANYIDATVKENIAAALYFWCQFAAFGAFLELFGVIFLAYFEHI